MKITLLTSNTSIEDLPRTRTLYNLLKENFELEVISIIRKKEKIENYKNEFPNFKEIKFDFGTIFKDLIKNVSGDIIYALKTKPASFGLATSLKNHKKIPVILDIDAIEPYNCYPYSSNNLKNFSLSIFQFNNPNSFIYTWLLERRIKFADDITISSPFLQKIYGGTFIPNACDTNFFNPEKYKRDEIRSYMGWNDLKIILFSGTVNQSIDLEILINAVKELNNPEIKIVIAGEMSSGLKKSILNESSVSLIESQPQLNIAKLITASDLFVLPLKNIAPGQGKLSANLFEAMAGELPIISTNIFDMPDILTECGIVTPVGNVESLKNNIKKVFSDRQFAKEIGKKARQKCINQYSKQQIEKKLNDFFKKFEYKSL